MVEIGRGGGLANWTVLTGRGVGTGREGDKGGVSLDRVGGVGAEVSGLASKEGVDGPRGGNGRGTRGGATGDDDDASAVGAAGEGRGRLGGIIDASEGMRGGVASVVAEGSEGMGRLGSVGTWRWSAVGGAAKVVGTGIGGGGGRERRGGESTTSLLGRGTGTGALLVEMGVVEEEYIVVARVVVRGGAIGCGW